jgi:uncharacterized protein YebE (UPF0316 family)
MTSFLDSGIYTWGIVPLLIFIARIFDVSLDTLRIIFINRNIRFTATLVGFFQVLIWLLVIRQIFQQLDNPLCFLAYAAGFATGNYIGIMIENKISIGKVIIRAITRVEAAELVTFLRSKGFSITVVDANGMTGSVQIIFMIVERRDIEYVVKLIKEHNPKAFYSIEDVRFVSEMIVPNYLPATPRWTNFISKIRRRV